MSERQTRRPEGEGVHGPFIRPHPASVTAGLRVTPEGRSLLPSVPSAPSSLWSFPCHSRRSSGACGATVRTGKAWRDMTGDQSDRGRQTT